MEKGWLPGLEEVGILPPKASEDQEGESLEKPDYAHILTREEALRYLYIGRVLGEQKIFRPDESPHDVDDATKAELLEKWARAFRNRAGGGDDLIFRLAVTDWGKWLENAGIYSPGVEDPNPYDVVEREERYEQWFEEHPAEAEAYFKAIDRDLEIEGYLWIGAQIRAYTPSMSLFDELREASVDDLEQLPES